MNGLFQIEDSLANKITYYHVMLLMASLPFNMFYSHLILISLFIHTLIHLKRSAIKPVFTLRNLALQSVFFITVLSTIYSINRTEGFTEWGKDSIIFLLPILFCLNPLDLKKYRDKLLLAFALVCTATIIYLYLDVLITIRHYGMPIKSLLSAAFTNHNFSEPIQMHATFFSMQVTIAFAFMIYAFFKANSNYHKLLCILCGMILACGLIQLSSKSIFIVLILIVNMAVPYFLLRGASRWKYILTSSLISICLLIGILNTGTFRERFVNELKVDLAKPSATEVADGRLVRWKVVAGFIKKSPIIGYGAGSEIGLLQDGFFSHKLYNSFLFRLNSHCQYLSFWLKSGIIGLLIYLLTLGFGFNIALRQQDFILFVFMLTITTISLSENLLDVDKGVFFYAFFFAFFIYSDQRKKLKSTNAIMVSKSQPSETTTMDNILTGGCY
jgi:O-antigen ligase